MGRNMGVIMDKSATEISTTEPRILHEGRYRLYEKPDGTLRIQYRRTDREEDDFMEIPGQVLKMAKLVSEGNLNPLQALKMMRNGANL